jgi:polar amino acid transport system substrate-binding protein
MEISIRAIVLHFKITLFSLLIMSFSVSSQHITVVTEHLAPFQIVDKNNNITGFSTDVVKAILNKTPHTYTIEANPWTVSYNQALKNSDICIYSLAYTESRKNKFQWAGELIRSTTSFYSLSSREISISHIEEAKKYNVAVIKDDVAHHYLLSKGFQENKNLYVLENYNALLDLLEIRKDSIDLIILNDELLKNRVKNSADKEKYKQVLLLDELELIFQIACNLKLPKQVVDDISTALKQIKSDDTYQTIKAKWQSYF